PLYYVPVIVLLIMAAMRLEEAGGLVASSSRSFGEHSFGIYLVHPLVIAALTAIWASLTGLSWTDWPTYPAEGRCAPEAGEMKKSVVGAG
ncbi:MAG: hypothetical protein WBK56_06500, partial [Methanoculleus sp.]